jgi:hypothetical protein
MTGRDFVPGDRQTPDNRPVIPEELRGYNGELIRSHR